MLVYNGENGNCKKSMDVACCDPWRQIQNKIEVLECNTGR